MELQRKSELTAKTHLEDGFVGGVRKPNRIFRAQFLPLSHKHTHGSKEHVLGESSLSWCERISVTHFYLVLQATPALTLNAPSFAHRFDSQLLLRCRGQNNFVTSILALTGWFCKGETVFCEVVTGI